MNRITLVLTIVTAMMFQSSAYAVPTKWEAIQLSMSELINSGWQISAYSNTRVAANGSFGFDERQFSFLLTKNGSYIICISGNPKPPIAANSDCRKLN